MGYVNDNDYSELVSRCRTAESEVHALKAVVSKQRDVLWQIVGATDSRTDPIIILVNEKARALLEDKDAQSS